MSSSSELSVLVSGSRRFLLSDVAKVAVQQHHVVVDVAALEKCDAACSKESPAEVPSSYLVTPSSVCQAPESFCRAAMCVRILSLVLGQSARSTVIDRLTGMLRAGIVPAFSNEESAGGELIGALMCADVKCYTKGGIQSTQTALAGIALTGPMPLTTTELTALRSGHFFTVGIASHLGSGAYALSQCLDCTAALSCEAVGSAAEGLLASLDAQTFEVGRQHRGQMSSAGNMRLLLEGSQRFTSAKSNNKGAAAPSSPAVADAASRECFNPFLTIPQAHGPVLETIVTTTKMLEIELNSFNTDRSGVVAFESTQVEVGIQTLRSVVRVALKNSEGRTALLAATAAANKVSIATTSVVAPPAATGTIAGDGVYEAAQQLQSAIDKLSFALAAEASCATAILASYEEAAAKQDEEGGDKAAPHKGGKKGGEDDDALGADEANLPEAVRLKIEEKRRKKAEAAAKKAQAKLLKKSKALALGVGSTKVGEHLKAFGGANATVTYNPFNFVSEAGSMSAFCGALLADLGSGGCRRPKICKGARDFGPEAMRIREQAFSTIRTIFKRHGAVEIDTPVFELKEVLMGKYGEDSKLIYDLADQGGELLCLRYDLTVPFARFLAMNTVGNIKRFHIAKVYRRDQPQPAKGRYREFYQCDIDIAGNYSLMVPDAEVITVAAEILTALPIGKFIIKLNHRRILDAIFEIAGVPAEKFRPICSAVDKLDKEPWTAVKSEMVNEKGLAPEVADRIGEFVLHNGRPKELWERLTQQKTFGDHVGANAAMEEMKLLFEYLEAMGSIDHVLFDMSLARGLDYYTGVIYEAVLVDGISQLGSIAAGGRYDNLVGMFSTSGQQTPCVGVSIGVERVMTIMENRAKALKEMNAPVTQVYVASIGPGLVPQRMRVAKILWESNISAEYSHQDNPKFKKQLDYVLEKGIPFQVVFGDEEVAAGTVKVKDMASHTEVSVPLADVGAYLLAHGCRAVSNSADEDLLARMKGLTVLDA